MLSILLDVGLAPGCSAAASNSRPRQCRRYLPLVFIKRFIDVLELNKAHGDAILHCEGKNLVRHYIILDQ